MTGAWAFIILFYLLLRILGIFYHRKLKKENHQMGGAGGDVPVVGGREDGDAAPAVRHLIALGLDLVATDDVVQVVLFQEGLGDVGPKLTTHTPLADRAPVLGRQGAQGACCSNPPALPTARTCWPRPRAD